MPLTPADFALSEGRFKKHFRPLAGRRRRRADARVHRPRRRSARARRRSSGRRRRRQDAGQDGSVADIVHLVRGAPEELAHPAVSGRPRRREARRRAIATSWKLCSASTRSGRGARILARLDRAGDVRAGGVVGALRPPARCCRLGGATAGGGAGCARCGSAAAKAHGSAPVTLAEEDVAEVHQLQDLLSGARENCSRRRGSSSTAPPRRSAT